MENKKTSARIWNSFLHPSVLLFILMGTAVIFLTFLTTNNALEIVISGIASVFIGIGVNNFSSLQMHLQDTRKLKSKINHSLKAMEISKSRVKAIHLGLNMENCEKMKEELAELEQIIGLSIDLIKEEASLD